MSDLGAAAKIAQSGQALGVDGVATADHCQTPGDGSALVADEGSASPVPAPRWNLRWCHLSLWRAATATKQNIPPSPPLGDELLNRLTYAVCACDLKIVEVNRSLDAVTRLVVGSPALGEPKQ